MTLYSQIAYSFFITSYDPTGEPYQSQRIIDGQPCILELLRITDYQAYIHSDQKYMKMCNGIIIMYSICNPDSLEHAKWIWKEVKKEIFEGEKRGDEHPIPILLLGNKTDREAERRVTREEGMDVAKRLGVGWMECSCKNYTGVAEACAGLVRLIRRKNQWEKQGMVAQDKTSKMGTDIRTPVPRYDAKIEKS